MAYTLNGTTQGFAYSASSGVVGADGTYFIWINHGGQGAVAVTIQQRDTDAFDGQSFITVEVSHKISENFYNTAYQFGTAPVSTSLTNGNIWVACGYWKSSADGKLIVNGSEEGTQTGTNRNLVAAIRCSIGYNFRDTNQFFNGKVSHGVIWNTPLLSTSLGALSRGVNPFIIQNENLQHYSPLSGNFSPEENWGSSLDKPTLTNAPAKFAGNPPVEHLSNYISGFC